MQEKLGKKNYRCHAHTNSFRDQNIDRPNGPDDIDWNNFFVNGHPPEYVDIGCGYGRFLTKTAILQPNINILGMEIREKVVEYLKITTKDIPNCSIVKTNALLFLINFFKPSTLSKIFILFPDPHFKKRKQKGRIVCKQNIQVLRYLLADQGQVYISTDVKELFENMCSVFENSGWFIGVEPEENDRLFHMCYKDTDEAYRAGVKSGHTFGKIYRVIKY